jgi:hypothetical protein
MNVLGQFSGKTFFASDWLSHPRMIDFNSAKDVGARQAGFVSGAYPLFWAALLFWFVLTAKLFRLRRVT